MGVISAVGGPWRTWQGGEIDRFVRADLSLYPRFSGSPLLDVAGRVVGLNTGGLSRRQAVTVPAATIQRVVETLLTRGGRIPRGYLGVALQGVAGGAIVLGVEQKSPADAGGAHRRRHHHRDRRQTRRRRGRTCTRSSAAATVGERLRIDVLRGGTPRQLEVVVGERPE